MAMSTHVADDEWERAGDRCPSEFDGADTVEAYEVEDGVVFYDAENPLAWLEATRVVSLSELL